MSQGVEAAYSELATELRRVAVFGSCAQTLEWDQQTGMPPRGAGHRAEQLALLAGMLHDQATSPRLGELIERAAAGAWMAQPDSVEAANVREAKRDFEHATKLPRALVEELSRVTTLGQQAWIEARKHQNFAEFLPWLEKIVALKKDEAAAIGFGTGSPYDALLDRFEPGMTCEDVRSLFTPLRDGLVTLIAAVKNSGRAPDRTILTRRYPTETQKHFSILAARAIGFDFDSGRLDIAAHPFCSGLGPGDVRLTTRYDEYHFPGAFFGTLHESGHGIYEQGLDPSAFGLGTGAACSLGIHESQSRLWENFVGRSHAFWQYFYPLAQQAFPEALATTPIDAFYRAINDVQPSFIRVEADEATYNLHIMLRFEIEQALVSGELAPKDVPESWNDRFSKYFGIVPPNDSEGCLQDIHWSFGGIGYFPTYTLGNMHAAQFFEAAQRDLGDLSALFARGEFLPLKEWLNKNIHSRGKQYEAGRLCEIVTGRKLSHEPLLKHLHDRFDPLYGL